MNILRRIRNESRTLGQCEQGVAFIEFAFCIIMLFILVLGVIEVSRYILIVQKVEKTVGTLSDVLTQSQTQAVPASAIAEYLNASQRLMAPYGMGANGKVILTDIRSNAAGITTVNWQVCGGGTLAAASQVANSPVPGSPVRNPLPITFIMQPNEEVVIGEMFYKFNPILTQNLAPSATIYRVALFKPRVVSNLTATSAAACP